MMTKKIIILVFVLLFVFFSCTVVILFNIDEKLGISFLLGGILLLFVFFSIFRPIFLIYVTTIIAASSTVFRDIFISVGLGEVNLIGFLWFFVCVASFFYVLINIRFLYIPFYLWFFLFFFFFAFLRWVFSPSFLGLKDLFWYSIPIVFSLFVFTFLKKEKLYAYKHIEGIEKSFLYCSLIVPVLLILALSTGLAKMTWQGPRGYLLGSSRAWALYLLVVISLSLAAWRYRQQYIYKLLSLVYLFTIFTSLGRMATFLVVVLFSLSKINPRYKTHLFIALLLSSLLFFYAVIHLSPLKRRFFFVENYSFTNLELKYINTAGRNILWPALFSSALQSPFYGHGLGSSRLLAAKVVSNVVSKKFTTFFPHNEYLYIFHDLGLLGLFLFVLCWSIILLKLYFSWKTSENTFLKMWSMSGFLSVLSVLISSLTDNTIHYPMVIASVSIITSVAIFIEKFITFIGNY